MQSERPTRVSPRAIIKLAAAVDADPRTIVDFVRGKRRTRPAFAAAILRAARQLKITLPDEVTNAR